jgi:AraC-like DNA-binding protein
MLTTAKNLLAASPMESDSLASEVLRGLSSQKNDTLYVDAYFVMGVANYYAGKYLLAVNYYKRALQSPLSEKIPTLHEAILNNLGIVYEHQGRLSEADKCYFQSMGIAGRAGDSIGYYQSCINLGSVNILLEKHSAAREYLTRAIAFFRRLGDDHHIGLGLNNLAILSSNQGDMAACLKNFEEAEHHYKVAGSDGKLFEMMLDRLYILSKVGMLEEAEAFMSDLLALERLQTNQHVSAVVYMIQGRLLTLSGDDYQEAERYFREAESIFRGIQANNNLIRLYESIIELYGRTDNAAGQREALQEYRRLLQEKYKEESQQKIAELVLIAETALQKEQGAGYRNGWPSWAGRLFEWEVVSILATGMVAALLYVRRRKRRVESKASPDSAEVEVSDITDRQTSARVAMSEPIPLGGEQTVNHQLFEEVDAYIRDRKRFLDVDLKINHLAYELGTNEKYISQAIQRGANMKFVDYIAQLRVEEAKRLLSEPGSRQYSVKEVAMKSGFGNQPQFQRRFKQLTGMTPSVFRATMQFGRADEPSDRDS